MVINGFVARYHQHKKSSAGFFHTAYRILQLMWINTRKCLREKKGYHIYWMSLSESYLEIIVVLIVFWSCSYFYICYCIGSSHATRAFEKALRGSICVRVEVYHNVLKASTVVLGGSWCSQLATWALNKKKKSGFSFLHFIWIASA